MSHDWPGNVRQLERVIERAVALAAGPVIDALDLPEEITKTYRNVIATLPERDESLRAWSSRYVRLVLDRCDGNKRRACDVLNISFHTLQAHLGYASAPEALAGRTKGARDAAAPGN